MESQTSDIRKELEGRMAEIQNEIGNLREERETISKKLLAAEAKLIALRTVYGMEAERLGESKAPLFVGKGAPSRFTGMKLIEALALVRKGNPKISKREACKILEREGFNFRTNRHLSAVHFAWIALEQKEKRGGR